MENILQSFTQQHQIFAFLLVLLIMAWSLSWKGVALWKAARVGQKIWFVVLLLANTVGILEIIYIFFVARKKCCAVMKPEEKLPVSR